MNSIISWAWATILLLFVVSNAQFVRPTNKSYIVGDSIPLIFFAHPDGPNTECQCEINHRNKHSIYSSQSSLCMTTIFFEDSGQYVFNCKGHERILHVYNRESPIIDVNFAGYDAGMRQLIFHLYSNIYLSNATIELYDVSSLQSISVKDLSSAFIENSTPVNIQNSIMVTISSQNETNLFRFALKGNAFDKQVQYTSHLFRLRHLPRKPTPNNVPIFEIFFGVFITFIVLFITVYIKQKLNMRKVNRYATISSPK
ncbi:hypothetical protein PCE1_002568 [Barthelona sp. PCE]